MAKKKDISKYLHAHMDKQAGIAHSQKRTKIVATVGPACDTYDKLLQLVKAGVNVFRLNFSHGTHKDKRATIKHIRKIIKEEPYNIAILGDLQGPKLRVGDLYKNQLLLKEADEIIFTSQPCKGNCDKVYISYEHLTKDAKVGERIFLDDGKIEVRVTEIINKTDLRVTVIIGGLLLPKKGVNLPDSTLSLPAITKKDMEDIEFCIDQKIDWIALSFVRKPSHIADLKKLIHARASKIKVIGKIEMPEALKHLREIILESDGIMIARGDLGVEIPIEQVPVIQKDIIRKCMHRAKPVIVATQMMESMMERTKPNRSEVSDVANAVMEGADAVMLSGETALGQFPVQVVKTMSKIIEEVEKTVYEYNREDILTPQSHSPSFLSDAICYSACKLAKDGQADALVGMTQSGYTGFTLSSFRPKCPLYVFSKEKSLITQLSLSWGVRAFYYPEEESLDGILNDQLDILKERGFLKSGDVVVNTGSTPVELHLPTNIIKISRIT
ncbi:MAG: pyruvate kinase [Ferruginibacter sp.]|nr:pyruvate kinase [Ferruginibacter sp.]